MYTYWLTKDKNKISFPFNLGDSYHMQTICQNYSGKWKIGQKKAHKTYNSTQHGYRHNADDIGMNMLYYGSPNHNIVINPFHKDIKVKLVSCNFSVDDKDGGSNANCGNYITLIAEMAIGKVKMRVCHLKKDSLFKNINCGDYLEAGQPICYVGCSGFSSVKNMHGHINFTLDNEEIELFAGKYNLFTKEGFIYKNQELLKILHHIEPDINKLHKRHKKGDGFHYRTWLSVNDSDFTHLHKIEDGKNNHYRLFIEHGEDIEINKIIMYENPFGLIPDEFNWLNPNTWQKWFKYHYNKQPKGNNLLDYCTNIKKYNHKIIYAYIKDEIVFPKNKSSGKPLYVKGTMLEFDCYSMKNSGDGLYTYIPIINNKIAQKFNLYINRL